VAKDNKDPKKGDLETTEKDAAEVKGGLTKTQMRKARKHPGSKKV
jgi:hypothetical protein